LVIDALITPGLLRLFPDHVRSRFSQVDILFHEEPVTLSREGLNGLECEFRLPSTLVRGIFDIDDGIKAEMRANIVVADNAAFLEVDHRRLFRLSPLKGERLGFVGWTMERYFQYTCRDGRVNSLALVLRRGGAETRIDFQLYPPT
jgi:hypothetical protein